MMRFAFLGVLALVIASSAFGQAPGGLLKPDDPPPPVTYRGLVPGRSTGEEVRRVLGKPLSEAKWYAYKMLYPAEKRPGLLDSIHLRGREGHLACIEAASIPAGLETRAAIVERLAQPEQEIRMATFRILDYSIEGVRFVLDGRDHTIGVAYFPHLHHRVHAGARKLIDLSDKRQGVQPAPEQPADLGDQAVGATQIKITPQSPDWIDPRYRANYVVHDDLWARTLVLRRGGLTIALVGADLFGMSLTDIEPMRERARKLGVDYFLLAMSHNHAAPDTIGVYGHYPKEYIAFLQDQIVASVEQALGKLQTVRQVRVSSRELPMNGARVVGFIRNARNVGLVDPTMSLLQFFAAGDEPIATVINFACHVEGLEKGVVELSADFPGYMCEQMQHSGLGQAIFLNGAVGGMISGDNRARTHEEAQQTGQTLAGIAAGLAFEAEPPAEFRFRVATRRVEIPVTNAKFKPLYDTLRPLVRGRVVTEMALVEIGECQMLTLPGELLPEVSWEIQEHMSGFPRILVGLANDELGYIIPEYDFRSDDYEESMSQGPAAAPIVRDTAIRLLRGEP